MREGSITPYLFSKEGMMDCLKTMVPFLGEINNIRKTNDWVLAQGEWFFYGCGRSVIAGAAIGCGIYGNLSNTPELYIGTAGLGAVYLLLSTILFPGNTKHKSNK